MIVRQFLHWVRQAPAGERAEATSALARAYLYSDLSSDDRAAAEGAMIMLLDDPSPLVRRALAEALATPFPATVRRLAVYTRGDGVVDWRTCIEGEDGVDVEVTGTHVGLVVNAAAYESIARALTGAEPATRPRAA